MKFLKLDTDLLLCSHLVRKGSFIYVADEVITSDNINSAVFPQMEFDITAEDIQHTFKICTKIWNDNKSLRAMYPDFLQRLNKIVSKVQNILDKKGSDYLLNLFKKVKFLEDDYFSLYEDYVYEVFRKSIKMLRSKGSVGTPKQSLKLTLSKHLGISLSELEDLLKAHDMKVYRILYDGVTEIMGGEFDQLKDTLGHLAADNGGTVHSRPSKFKDYDRAVQKFLNNELDDFLDVSDLLGFRVTFSSVQACIDFSLDLVELLSEDVFYLNVFTGKASAYQGINLKVNHNGLFNYEIQVVSDLSQVATDLNHDVLYKKMVNLTQHETNAVMMLVQISLGLVFDDMFNFYK